MLTQKDLIIDRPQWMFSVDRQVGNGENKEKKRGVAGKRALKYTRVPSTFEKTGLSYHYVSVE